MPRVVITMPPWSIGVSSKADAPANSYDISGGKWSEMSGWDPTKQIKPAMAALDQQQGTREVNCKQGQNRSPTMATIWLWRKTGKPLGEVFAAMETAYAQMG